MRCLPSAAVIFKPLQFVTVSFPSLAWGWPVLDSGNSALQDDFPTRVGMRQANSVGEGGAAESACGASEHRRIFHTVAEWHFHKSIGVNRSSQKESSTPLLRSLRRILKKSASKPDLVRLESRGLLITKMNLHSHSSPVALISTLNIVTLILSVYVLIALFVQTAFHLTPATNEYLDHIDFYVCMIFLFDFFTRLYQAPSKLAFLKWGWIDFISSIPMLDMLRVGRVVRIIRIFRMLRAFRSTKYLLRYFLHERKTTSLIAVACIAFVLVVFSSIAMLQFETSADANIKTPIDAFWWAYATITTVGYGDKFPLSVEGRVVACLLMTAGVGLFGTFTGFVAKIFVEPQLKQDESDIQQLTREIQALRTQLQSIEEKLNNNSSVD